MDAPKECQPAGQGRSPAHWAGAMLYRVPCKAPFTPGCFGVMADARDLSALKQQNAGSNIFNGT